MSSGGYDPPERPAGTDNCGRLSFQTVLASVQEDVLAGTARGDVCSVVVAGVAPARQLRVVTSDGGILGVVVDNWADLAACIEAGYDYTATIQTTTAPVRVLVAPA